MDKGDTPRCMPEKGEPVYNGLKELRDSLGLSENGLRLYEREGLMRCWRKEANNYRFTTLSEGIRLCGSYSLVRTGFSISEVRDLIALPRDEYTEALDGICKDLTHDLQLLAARKEQLERHIDALHSYMHDPFKCTETEPPVHFVVPAHDENLTFYQNRLADVAMWWQSSPLVSMSTIVTVNEKWKGVHAEYGPSSTGSNVFLCRLPMEHARPFCTEGTTCLKGYVTYPSGCLPNADAYRHIVDWMAKHKRDRHGDQVLHAMLDLNVTDDGVVRLDEVLVPLEG